MELRDVFQLPVTEETIDKTLRNAVHKYMHTNTSMMYDRTPVELLDNLYMGDLAKNALLDYLRAHCSVAVVDYDEIRTDNFEEPDPGWDIMVGDTKLKIEVKSSTPPNGESRERILSRDIKITASHDKGNTWIMPEELESDLHVQIYFYATPYKNGYSTFDALSRVVDRDYKKAREIISADKYNEPLFYGYNTKEYIIEHLKGLSKEKRTWTFSWTKRIYWSCPIKEAHNLDSLVELLNKQEARSIVLHEEICKKNQYSEYLPFYSVRAACGGFVDGGIPEEEGWIKVVDYGVKANKDRFVVRASGDSMLPKIHSGDYCVFERNWAGTRNGLIVLAQSRDFDADYSGKYTIKKYHSEARMTDDWEVQKTIDLVPLNSDYDTIHLSEDDDVAIIGVLVGVIDGNAKPIEKEPDAKEELGFCIRCHKHIDYSYGAINPKYYCHECWQKWHRAGDNKLEKEKYCHRCGQEKYARYKNFTCFDYPLCSDCWNIEQEK